MSELGTKIIGEIIRPKLVRETMANEGKAEETQGREGRVSIDAVPLDRSVYV